jgi:hypothetical protein
MLPVAKRIQLVNSFEFCRAASAHICRSTTFIQPYKQNRPNNQTTKTTKTTKTWQIDLPSTMSGANSQQAQMSGMTKTCIDVAEMALRQFDNQAQAQKYSIGALGPAWTLIGQLATKS